MGATGMALEVTAELSCVAGEVIEKTFNPPEKAELEAPLPPRGRGRPAWKYKPEYAQAILDFFESFDSSPQRVVKKKTTTDRGESEDYMLLPPKWPTLAKFARTIGVLPNTLCEWADRYPDFAISYDRCKQVEKSVLVDAAYCGLTPPATFQFLAANFTDMKPAKTERDINVNVAGEAAPAQVKNATPEQLAALEEMAEKARALGISFSLTGIEDRTGGSLDTKALSPPEE